MKPSAVAVVVPNVGFNAAASDVAVTRALPDPTAFGLLVVVIVAVELVPVATPVTVTKPLALTTTVPDAVAVPAHVYKVL